LCYSTNYIANIAYSYNLIDTAGRIIKSFLNKYLWEYDVQRGTAIFDENLFFRFNNNIFKKEIYSDTIFVFKDLDFKPYKVIKHGEKLLTTKARSDFDPRYLKENYISQKNLFEFGDYIYYEFITGSAEIYGLLGSKKNNYQALVNPEQGFINDLDGGPNIWPKTIKDDNTIISWINAYELKKHVASDVFKNSTPKYPEKKKQLERLANKLKETDNPVIMMVRLKK
jgi:hypothetical protein